MATETYLAVYTDFGGPVSVTFDAESASDALDIIESNRKGWLADGENWLDLPADATSDDVERQIVDNTAFRGRVVGRTDDGLWACYR